MKKSFNGKQVNPCQQNGQSPLISKSLNTKNTRFADENPDLSYIK